MKMDTRHPDPRIILSENFRSGRSRGAAPRRFILYPFEMSPSQVRAIHNKFEREGDS